MSQSLKQIKVHPAAELFPMMSEEELQGLTDDIHKNGLSESIVLWHDGRLLDGRNRLEACNRLGIEPSVAQFDSDSEINPVEYVLSHNLHRRHLSPSQKAMVAVKLKELLEPEAKERQKRKPAQSVEEKLPQQKERSEQSRDIAAKAVGISGKLVDAAEKVQEKGTDELKQAVTSGKVSVSKAAKAAELPESEQMAKAMEPRKPRSDEPRLKGDIEQFADKLVIARWLFDSCSEQQRASISIAWSDWWNDN